MMKRGGSIKLAVLIIMAAAVALLLPCLSFAGSLEPSDPPGPTMKTLDQIPPTWSQRLPASERFQGVFEYLDVCYVGGHPYPCIKYDAVLDKETGLVWQKTLDTTDRVWQNARSYCNELSLGGRMGWRLPTVQELASLVDPTVPDPGPTLPSGHPFANVQSATYWSANTSIDNSTGAWLVNFQNAKVYWYYKTANRNAWCVRGGQSVDSQ
jgi:hypothetical protein